MIKKGILKVWVVLLINMFIVSVCWAKGEVERIKSATRILSNVMSGPEGTAPKYLLSHARAVILIPGVKKIGFIAGIKHGKGIIVARGKDNKWLPPSFVTLSGGSIGFQIGGKSSDIVILLMSDKALQKFTGNKIKIGVDFGVVAGPVGKEIGLSQEDLYKIEAFSYIKEKGIFAGATIAGSLLSHDEKANQNFYGIHITFHDILSGKIPPLPPAAQELLQTLETLSQ